MTLNVSNHNVTLLADHFLDPQSIPRVLYSTNQFLIDITDVLTIYYQVLGWLHAYQKAYVIDISAKPSVIFWIHNASMK